MSLTACHALESGFKTEDVSVSEYLESHSFDDQMYFPDPDVLVRRYPFRAGLAIGTLSTLALGLALWLGVFQPDPVVPETIVEYVERPATQKEIESGRDATPDRRRTYEPTPPEERVSECIEVPDFLAARPVEPDTEGLDFGIVVEDIFRPDSTETELPFDVLPDDGGVVEDGPNLVVRRYDPNNYRWNIDLYEREYHDAWLGTVGGGYFQKKPFGYLGVGRRSGRFEYWAGPMRSVDGDWGAIGGLTVRF